MVVVAHNPFSAFCWHNFKQHAVPNSTDAGRYWTARVCHRKSLKKLPKGPTLVMVKGGTGHDSWERPEQSSIDVKNERNVLDGRREGCFDLEEILVVPQEEGRKCQKERGLLCAPYTLPPPTHFTQMSRLNCVTGWVIVTVHIHSRV